MKTLPVLILPLLFAALSLLHAASITPIRSPKVEFAPIRGEKFPIAFKTDTDGNVTIEICSPDRVPVRTLNLGYQKAGKHKAFWDGKDNEGDIVPDEAYAPVFKLRTNDGNITREFWQTGGEILQNLHRKADRAGNIYYTLPKPARVLVRVGIEGGPMLRILSNWTPRAAGRIRQRWNFKDDTGKVNFESFPYLAAVSAFSLPEFSIITTGNTDESYLDYIKRKRLPCLTPKPTEEMLVRNGKRISLHYFKCRREERTPSLFLSLDSRLSKNGHPVLEQNVATTVTLRMPPADLNLIKMKQYEVSFYIDGTFVSEAEQGYIPIRWRYTPTALKKGKHILSVNVTTFDGNVAAKSTIFYVK